MALKTGLTLLWLGCVAAAQSITIHSVRPIPEPNVKGKFQPKVLTVTFDPPPPKLGDAEDTSKWAAVCFQNAGTPTLMKVTQAVHDKQGKPFASVHTVTLSLELTEDPNQDPVKQCDMAEVTFLIGTFPSQRWAKKKPQAGPQPSAKGDFLTGLFSPAKGNGTPDYSISGTIVPAVGSGPLYSLDASAQYKIVKGDPWSSTFNAKANTSSSHTADLDSFSWSLGVLHVPEGRWSETITPVSMEFNKTGDAMNVISGGAVVFTMFNTKTTKFTPTGGESPQISSAFDLRGGIELGDNFKNSFTIANRPSQGGSGFIFRGVPSARFALVIPTSNPKHELRLTSTYTVRLPARDELFLETRLHTKNPVPLLGTNPRHYIQNQLTFKLTDFFSFKIQHTYGSLPPSFKFANHSASVGIVFQANQP